MVNRGRKTPRRGGRPPRHPGIPAGLPRIGNDDEQQRLPIDLTPNAADEQQRLPVDLTPDDDDVEEGSDDGEEECCFTRTLTPGDVDRVDPRILMDSFEAMTLTGDPELLELPPSGNFSRTLSVFDDTLCTYSMILSDYLREGVLGYTIDHEWGLYVRNYMLAAGDQIFFFRKYNMDVSEPYYDIRVSRMPIRTIPMSMTGLVDVAVNEIPLEAEYIRKVAPREDWPPEEYFPPIESWLPEENSLPSENRPPEEKSPDHKKKPGPGSRVLPENSICLSKKLCEYEVDHVGDNPRLYLTVADAGFLIGCPNIKLQYPEGTLLENLVVFDTDDRPYDMLLTHFTSRIFSAGYTLDAGWQRFVHIHNLKDGDDVFFHKIEGETINGEPYYVVRYDRNNLHGGSGVDPSDTGMGPGGSGIDPSDSGTGPGGSGVDPSDSGVSPNVIEVGPTGSGVNPGDSGVSPSVIEVGPNGSEVDPGDSGVSPTVSEVDQSGSGDKKES